MKKYITLLLLTLATIAATNAPSEAPTSATVGPSYSVTLKNGVKITVTSTNKFTVAEAHRWLRQASLGAGK